MRRQPLSSFDPDTALLLCHPSRLHHFYFAILPSQAFPAIHSHLCPPLRLPDECLHDCSPHQCDRSWPIRCAVHTCVRPRAACLRTAAGSRLLSHPTVPVGGLPFTAIIPPRGFKILTCPRVLTDVCKTVAVSRHRDSLTSCVALQLAPPCSGHPMARAVVS